jgi:hypothetical protein
VDKQIQLDKTTAGDVRRVEGRSERRKPNRDGWVAHSGRTRYFLLQPSLPLIQATLVRGALVLVTSARPACHALRGRLTCLKRSKHKTSSFITMLSRVVHWRNWSLPGTIQLMDPSLISKVMQEMGRKGGKKGGKKGAKMRAEALTPEQRSQIARKAAKTRWAKARKKH